MGIVIAYKGSLNDPTVLGTLLEDMRRCATVFDWKCRDLSYAVSGVAMGQSFSDDRRCLVEDEITGINILPPGTGTFTLTFNRRGKLAQYIEIPRQLLANQNSSETFYLESTPWVKTTGEIDSHILILVLLRRIKTRYMRDLEVEDDTDFWETGDLGKLHDGHTARSVIVSAAQRRQNASAMMQSIGEDPDIVLEPLDPAAEPKPFANFRKPAAWAN